MPRLRRFGRVAVFNAVGVGGGLVVVACVAEVYARSKAEFRYTEKQVYYHPRAGRLFVPGSELRQTNMLDFRTVSRVNNNNPWYNHFRSTQLNRKVVAARADDGSFELLPPCPPGGCDPARVRAGHSKGADDARWADDRGAGDVLRASGPSASAPSVLSGLGRIERVLRSSYAVGMLQTMFAAFSALRSFPKPGKPTLQIWSSIYAEWFGDEEDWPGPGVDLQRDLPPMGREALEYTEFALDQWMVRANRDSFTLAVLASHSMGTRGDMRFDLLNALASPRGIPVIDQLGYIARHGGRIEDAHWPTTTTGMPPATSGRPRR